MLGTCWKSKICDLAVAKTSIKWRCYWILGKIVLLDGYLMDRDRLVVAKRRPLRPSPGLQPATRKVAGFRSPFFRPPCIHEAHFRHRGVPVYGFLRPSATVAAWQPGPAAPVRGKASIPPGVIHAQRTSLVQIFLHDPSASTGPASSVADPDRASAIRNPNKLQKEAATAPEASGSGRCRCGATNCITKLPAVASAITSSYVM